MLKGSKQSFSIAGGIILIIILFPYFTFSQVRIMPMGNSITKGSTGSVTGGYRGLLYSTLKSVTEYPDVVFVGEKSWTYDNVFTYYDDDTEAYHGWSTTDIINVINGEQPLPPEFGAGPLFPSRVPTDIILLHIGTNDIHNFSGTPIEIADNVNTILDDIRGQNSGIVVILARIIKDISDGVNGTRAINTIEYNNLLTSTAVDKIIFNNNKLIVVDMDEVFDYNIDMFDGLHPDQSGYNKMEAVWLNALDGYFIDKPTLISPLSTSVNQSVPVTLAWGLTQHATKYFVQISENDNTFQPGNLIYNNGTGDIINPFLENLDNQSAHISNGGFKSSTTYWWRVQSFNSTLGDLGDYYSDVWSFTTPPLYVNVKVFLQGPYNGVTMNTNLRTLPDFPKAQQPYNVSPWNYPGNESVTIVPEDIVDWVLIQLRTGSSPSTATTIAQRAAFLKNDGTIVDLDGTSSVSFEGDFYGDNSGIPFGNYYIVLKHRNHLAVMSADAVSLTNGATYIFTNSNIYGTNAMADLGGGKFGMYSGNGDLDNASDVDINDVLEIYSKFLIGASGYEQCDVLLTGDADINSVLEAYGNFLIGASSQVP